MSQSQKPLFAKYGRLGGVLVRKWFMSMHINIRWEPLGYGWIALISRWPFILISDYRYYIYARGERSK